MIRSIRAASLLSVSFAFALRPAASCAADGGTDAMFQQSLRSAAVEWLKQPLSLHAAPSVERNGIEERNTLLELLRDPDPSVRQAAARALRPYVDGDLDARHGIAERAMDVSETEAVRKQAVKTLSWAGGHYDVRVMLADLARGSRSVAVRAAAAKALYQQARVHPSVRSLLLDLSDDDPSLQVRGAALWGLFLATGEPDVRGHLLDRAKRGSSPILRIEALKSLYGAVRDHLEVKGLARDIARSSSEHAAVRFTAILALSAASGEPDVRNLLTEIAGGDPDARLRRAAVVALDPYNDEIFVHFHLPRRTPGGHYIDPLDAE